MPQRIPGASYIESLPWVDPRPAADPCRLHRTEDRDHARHPATVQQAQAGDAAAPFTLADRYRATAQPEKMLHGIQASADQGYPLAQTSLGVITLNGDGVPPDRAVAYLWFGRAADQNDSDAMQFANDIDLELSEERARQWIDNRTGQPRYRDGNGNAFAARIAWVSRCGSSVPSRKCFPDTSTISTASQPDTLYSQPCGVR
jgi:hypothetical protein